MMLDEILSITCNGISSWCVWPLYTVYSVLWQSTIVNPIGLISWQSIKRYNVITKVPPPPPPRRNKGFTSHSFSQIFYCFPYTTNWFPHISSPLLQHHFKKKKKPWCSLSTTNSLIGCSHCACRAHAEQGCLQQGKSVLNLICHQINQVANRALDNKERMKNM